MKISSQKAAEIRKLSETNEFNEDSIKKVLFPTKPQIKSINVKYETVSKYFGGITDQKEIVKTIIAALEQYMER